MLLFDKFKINSERTYSDEGFLTVPARISRTGIQEYMASEMGLADREPDEIIKVYRPEEEVFDDLSLSSFSNKPVTNDHPPELVNPKNAKQYQVGSSAFEITRDGMFVKTVLTITDEETIRQIESGKVELSNGYTADIEWTSGISPNGERYDAIQRNIKGNHVAVVERGRAGFSCRVADNKPEQGDKSEMAKITIDGVDYEVSEQAAQAVGKLQANLADTEKKALKEADTVKEKDEEMEKAKDEAKKTEDSLKAQLDDAKSKIPSFETLDNMVANRSLFIDAIKSIDPEIEWLGKDEDNLRKEIVSAKCPNVQMDSASNDYIKARFDILVEDAKLNSQHALDDAFTKQVKTDDSNKIEDTRATDVIAREKFMEDSRNAWKKKGDK